MKSNDFCGHYICKIICTYIGLCLVAYIAYFVIACVAGLDLINGSDKVTLIASLIAWTGAMIVPIAAGFAISDWREQQRLIQYSEYAKDTLKELKKCYHLTWSILNNLHSIKNKIYPRDNTYIPVNIDKHFVILKSILKKFPETIEPFGVQITFFYKISNDLEINGQYESYAELYAIIEQELKQFLTIDSHSVDFIETSEMIYDLEQLIEKSDKLISILQPYIKFDK